MVKIKTALEIGIERLVKREYNNPMLEVKLLLAYVLGMDKNELFFRLEEEISDEKLNEFYTLLEKRVKGYPIQYIIGNQEFMGLDFKVEEGILIPRPDTEVLVENIIKIAENRYKGKIIRILDLCTGSGAIAISLAKYLSNSLVDAVDISDSAIEIARHNAIKNRVDDRVNIIKSDLFENIKRKYNIIVSNPPYIETETIDSLQIEVSEYEPRIALDGGKDGLKFYKEIIKQSVNYIEEDGILGFEIGHNQGKIVSELMNIDFYNIEIIKDLAKNDRVVIGYMK
ncbi:MAG: peptide chain release factor N(5)-glutamine methyltransferase [Andreesenia angusta]|nr:peptide chain release factor N(5)-glutamine methyltransferase [Andreesenia angusta]